MMYFGHMALPTRDRRVADGSLDRGRVRAPLGSVSLSLTVIALLLVEALYASWALRGLYADGARFLAIIVEANTFTDFDWSRRHAHWLTQAPLVLGLNAGPVGRETSLFLHSLGLFAVPAVALALSLWWARSSPVAFAFVLLAVVAIYRPSNFFIISESHTACALATLAAVLLFRVRDHPRALALVVLAFALLLSRTYESMLFIGPVLALVSLALAWRQHRLARDRLSVVVLVLCAVVFFAGAAVALHATLFPRFPENLRGFAGSVWHLPQHVGLLTTGLAVAAALALALLPAGRARHGLIALYLLGLVLLALLPALTLLQPHLHWAARVLSAAPFAVLLAVLGAIYTVGWAQRPLWRRLSLALVALVAAQTVQQMWWTAQWSGFVATYRSELAAQDGRTAFAATRTALPEYDRFVWPSYNRHLSAALRPAGSDAVIADPVP